MPAIEVQTTIGETSPDIAQLSLLAARLDAAVREAGALALSMFGKPVKNWTKGPAASPVSAADIAANDLLQARLTGAAQQFDGASAAWLSEESADDPARLNARYVWIVDPIDGTRAYLEGLPDWTVSVALADNGRPVLACLFAPATDEFFMARAGAGATRNGTPIAVSNGAELAAARISGPRAVLQRLDSAAPGFTVVPRVRSLALRLARVAQGIIDIAIAGGNSHDWDLAAADLLVHEAGGALTPVGGGTVIYNRPVPRHGMLVAAGRDRHAALIERLGDGRLALS